MSFFFKPACEIDIKFKDVENRDKILLKKDKNTRDKDKDKTELLSLFVDSDIIAGTVSIQTPPNKIIEHQGIKIELIGQIELFYDRGNHFEFLNLTKEIAKPGELKEPIIDHAFEFTDVEKKNESYNGINVRSRYFVKVTILRSFPNSDVIREQDFWVHSYIIPPEINNTIKMEVGIEDCLHIEFEYDKSKYHLKDVIIGKIYFLLVRIKVKHMEIVLIKKEATGTGSNSYNESENIVKFEIMDGTPVKGESIPVRMFLGGFDLTPTYKTVHSKFSVKYYINLVLIDEDDRRYFKQQEVVFWRKQPKKLKSQKIHPVENRAVDSNEVEFSTTQQQDTSKS